MKFLCFLLIFQITNVISDDVDYYVNLIGEETDRSSNFQLPKDSSAFQTASIVPKVAGSYDYIIIGAGSAGSVVVNRLSENPDIKVLLLEAGGHETNFSDIPRQNIFLQRLEFNWNYNTTPQTTSCLGMINRECPYPRGRGLGGSSIINALMYVRGNKRDFNNWKDQGNPGWAYEDVLPFFKKSEDSQIGGDPKFHSKGGYLNVEYHTPDSPQLNAFIDANLELGRKIVDYNAEEQLGVARTQINTIHGRRDSTGKAFLRPAMNRPNLKIQTNSLVTKILLHPVRNEVVGVEYSYNGKLHVARARKEVILSAGTIGSPQLLMLSGIGPADHLLRNKIRVRKSLPVGENFHDHPCYFALHFVTNYTEPAKTLRENVKDYLNSAGAFSIAGNAQGLGFFQTKLAKIPGYPDIELIMVPSNNTANLVKKTAHYTDETYKSVWEKIDPQRTFTLLLILLHPKSRGTIKLKSKNPFHYPLIDSNFLSDPRGEDIETMYQGVQLALEIANTNAFKKFNTSLLYAPLPACSSHEYMSKNYWYCQLRQLTFNIYHPVGTCKMGPNYRTSVVDNKLRVHGVDKLRVVDASIIPEATSGHTNAVAIMIGEKAADMINKGE